MDGIRLTKDPRALFDERMASAQARLQQVGTKLDQLRERAGSNGKDYGHALQAGHADALLAEVLDFLG